MELPGELYLTMVKWQAQHPAEISGYGVVVDGRVEHIWFAAKGTTAGVTATADTKSKILLEALSLGYDELNMQWHSHYGMTPYFSHTDESTHAQFLKSAKTQKQMLYICFDQMQMVARQFYVQELRYVDGLVSVDGVTMPSVADMAIAAYTFKGGFDAKPRGDGSLTPAVVSPGEDLYAPYLDDRSWVDWLKCSECPYQNGCHELNLLRQGHTFTGECAAQLRWEELAWQI